LNWGPRKGLHAVRPKATKSTRIILLARRDPGRLLVENELAIALADAFPVSPGHTLVISRRHVSDFFDLTAAEVAAVCELLFRMRSRVAAEHDPAGFNIAVNVGTAAGQTVMHVYVHLIPRYPGDVPDPAGGIRNLIPGMGRYGPSVSRRA
jgi:diadenosine tetraphosphate (Ap4A) HIT family hydrolase